MTYRRPFAIPGTLTPETDDHIARDLTILRQTIARAMQELRNESIEGPRNLDHERLAGIRDTLR